MDTQDQIFGLIESAQQQQAAVSEALARLTRVTQDFKTSSDAAVSAIQTTTAGAVVVGIDRASDRAFDTVAQAVNPLYSALKEVAASADEATKGYHRAASSIHFRWVAVAGGTAACCIAAVMSAGWISLTWQRHQVAGLVDEKVALVAEVAALQAQLSEWNKKASRATLNTCASPGQKGRVCVRVDPDRGIFGDKDRGLYYVIYGY